MIRIVLIFLIISCFFILSCETSNSYSNDEYDEIITNKNVYSKNMIMPNADTVLIVDIELKKSLYYKVKIFQPDYNYRDYRISTFIFNSELDTIKDPYKVPFVVNKDGKYYLGVHVSKVFTEFPDYTEFIINIYEYTPFPDSLNGLWLLTSISYNYDNKTITKKYSVTDPYEVFQIENDTLIKYTKSANSFSGYASYTYSYLSHHFSDLNMKIYNNGLKINYSISNEFGKEEYELTSISSSINNLDWKSTNSEFFKNSKLLGNWFLSEYYSKEEESVTGYFAKSNIDIDNLTHNNQFESNRIIKITSDSIYLINKDPLFGISESNYSLDQYYEQWINYKIEEDFYIEEFGHMGIFYNVFDAENTYYKYKKYYGSFPPEGW